MKKSGFTINELLGVITIIVILAAILFPVFASATGGAKSKQAQCISSLKKLGFAYLQYAKDYDNTLPSSFVTANGVPGGTIIWSWGDCLVNGNYINNLDDLVIKGCPENYQRLGTSYGTNRYFGSGFDGVPPLNLSKIKSPADTLMLIDNINYNYGMHGFPYTHGCIFLAHLITSPTCQYMPPGHLQIVNIAYVDGHVKPMLKNVLGDGVTLNRIYVINN